MIDSLEPTIIEIEQSLDTLSMSVSKLCEISDTCKLWGMNVGELVMAMFALLAIIVNVICYYNTQNKHIKELELARAQRRYDNICNIRNILCNNGVWNCVYELSNDIKDHNDYESYEKKLYKVLFEYEQKHRNSMSELKLYGIKYNINGLNIEDSFSVINKNVICILRIVSFFKFLSNQESDNIKDTIQKNYTYVDGTFKVLVAPDKYENMKFLKYCELYNYDYESIKDNILKILIPINDNINNVDELTDSYFCQIIASEQNKLNKIYKKLGMHI